MQATSSKIIILDLCPRASAMAILKLKEQGCKLNNNFLAKVKIHTEQFNVMDGLCKQCQQRIGT